MWQPGTKSGSRCTSLILQRPEYWAGRICWSAIILLFLASRSSPSRVEVEALEVRRNALAGIGSALSLTQMVLPVLRLAMSFGRRRRI